jgi:Plavaka transposase
MVDAAWLCTQTCSCSTCTQQLPCYGLRGCQTLANAPIDAGFACLLLSPVLQVYTDKTACNRTTTAYPIKVVLLNITERVFKVKHMSTLGFIPKLPPVAGKTDQQTSEAKRVLLSLCLALCLQPLAAASHAGLHLIGPDNSLRWVYPRLACYPADNPEQHQVVGLYATCNCQLPCARCAAPQEELGSVSKRFPPRTAAVQAAIRGQIAAAGTRTAAAVISKQFSTHPEEPGLTGFAGQDNPLGECA